MKLFINKTNNYLLERYPMIWNTKLIWMLICAFCFHCLFFGFGYFTFTNPELLHDRYVKSIFFENGTIFLSSIISILLIVVWLVYMFKNNAFKNFYPTKTRKLFGQFVCYMIIIFSCSSFYISYYIGVKSYITLNYTNTQLQQEIAIANDVALFFSEDINDYTIDKKRYPEPFNTLYCEKTEDFIDYNQAYTIFKNKPFQHYSLTTREVPYSQRYNQIKNYEVEHSNTDKKKKYVFSIEKDTTVILHFKDKVVDISPFVTTHLPSYYNASHTFFISKHDTLRHKKYNKNNRNYSSYTQEYRSKTHQFSLRNELRSQRNHQLLQRNSVAEIEELIGKFLKFSKAYKIPHNINAKQWTNLVYHPNTFEVKHFIRTTLKPPYENKVKITKSLTELETYYNDRLSDFYYDNTALRYVFENIEDLKSINPLKDSKDFFMWFCFCLASIIFMFRVTGLKPLLFSAISFGLLTLIISLFAMALLFIFKGYNEENILFIVLYFILVIGTIILAIPICWAKRINKQIVAICLNISIIGFPLYVFLILSIVTMHQYNACKIHPDYGKSNFHCNTLLSSLDIYWSAILFGLGIVFIAAYCHVIKTWKALAEG